MKTAKIYYKGVLINTITFTGMKLVKMGYEFFNGVNCCALIPFKYMVIINND